MRSYIFTATERKILKGYLSKGKKGRHFNVVASLIRRNAPVLAEDLRLIERLNKRDEALFSPIISKRKQRKLGS